MTAHSPKRARRDRRTLDEHASKRLLASYGVPVVEETVVGDAAEAAEAAAGLGFPVVVKALGGGIAHKSERGLVRLGLSDPAAVERAARELVEEAGDELEGVLVQPMVSGRRELVAGLARDPGFGPVVMFGLGGVLTEALAGTSFRLAPLSAADADELIDESPAAPLLGALRGESAAARDRIAATLVGLSRLAEERPDILEVDVNPLLVTPGGEVVAVDALVVAGRSDVVSPATTGIDPETLGRLFYPRGIALIGASGTVGKWGHLLLTNLVAGGYERPIYAVNPSGGEIAGRPVYRSIEDVPEPFDLAIVAVPAAAVEDLLPALAAKGANGVVVVSSGFSEVGEAGAELERRLVETASRLGLALIGPNTMGITNPHARLYGTGSHVRPIPGSTALIAQSGNLGTQLMAFAEQQGIGIRAFCGSGNEAMITVEDYMEAFEIDDVTRSVVLYLEGLRQPRRFFDSARRISPSKPVVVLKGGRTRTGGRAAASHTGAMAGEHVLFAAACRQAGVLEVEQPMDLLDLSAAFSSLPLPSGARVAIMTLGGGWGVVATDLCEEHGLRVVPLGDDVVAAIDPLLPEFWSRANPVDLVGTIDAEVAERVTEILADWDGCDAVLNFGILGQRLFIAWMLDSVRRVEPSRPEEQVAAVDAAFTGAEERYVEHVVRVMERTSKPIIGVKLLEEASHRTVFDVDDSPYRGVFFQTPERAVKALARMVEYRTWLDRRSAGGG